MVSVGVCLVETIFYCLLKQGEWGRKINHHFDISKIFIARCSMFQGFELGALSIGNTPPLMKISRWYIMQKFFSVKSAFFFFFSKKMDCPCKYIDVTINYWCIVAIKKVWYPVEVKQIMYICCTCNVSG